ncbi:MAG: hypothetical protein ACLQGP_17520 [Isosphaeraceae bacterium]
MRGTRSGLRIANTSLPAFGVAILAMFGGIAAIAQDTARSGNRTGAGGPYPRLPGAITKAPDWIGTDTPFDVARFFAAPPRDRNAAPLYLDAFFEFGAETAACFPEGPERDRRLRAVKDRQNRYMELVEPLSRDPKSVPASSIDAVIRLYDVGFRKIAEAQRRDRCVFESSQGDTIMPVHLDGARQFTRITSLRIGRDADRREFDAAAKEIQAVLRVARDLQPRGTFLAQLVTAALDQVVCADVAAKILASPGLRVEDCDRLLKVFLAHEASSSDGYAEGLRADYVAFRITVQDLARHQRELARQLGVKPGQSVVKAVLAIRVPGLNVSLPDDIDARIARTSPADLSRRVGEWNRYYRSLLELDGIPYGARLARIAATRPPRGDDALSLVVRAMPPMADGMLVSLAQGISRATASLRATECLIALRRWQLAHRGLPRALAVVVKEAGLKAIPTDPYDGKPIRLAVIDGQPVIYSVGRDGRDDGGLKDSNRDMQPTGDLIYRLPAVEARR